MRDLKDDRSFDNMVRHRAAVQLVAGRVLADLADDDERIVGATADLMNATHMSDFHARHPHRVFDFGISERNMITAAAGMASCGMIPYVSTFAAFAGLLGYECIRTDLAYPGMKVRVLATHSGISMGFFGTSHHATEDLSALRSVANLTVISPADGLSTEALLRETVDRDGPIYFRLGRGLERSVYDILPDGYRFGEPALCRAGSDLLIVSTGFLVGECRAAADGPLADAGIDAAVVDLHTLKPFPHDRLAELAAGHRSVLVVEDHNVEGGLGSMVTESLAGSGLPARVYRHGLYDEYAITGPPTHLYRYYGLSAEGIATVAERLVLRRAELPLGRVALWTADDRAGFLAGHPA